MAQCFALPKVLEVDQGSEEMGGTESRSQFTYSHQRRWTQEGETRLGEGKGSRDSGAWPQAAWLEQSQERVEVERGARSGRGKPWRLGRGCESDHRAR